MTITRQEVRANREKDLKKKNFADGLRSRSDKQLVDESANYVWLSGYAANNPRSDYHWKCDACYDEARRREKPWLYQRGWNQAYRQAGHTPTEADLVAARESSP